MFHGLTELNSQRDALESVRNVYLHGKVCRVATGSNLSGFNCSFTSTLLELNKLAFDIMLQALPVKVVLKSSLITKISQLIVSSAVRMFPLLFFTCWGITAQLKFTVFYGPISMKETWSSAFRRG